MRALRGPAALLLILGLFSGCKPVQPTIRPSAVAVNNTTSAGMSLRVHLIVNNPNRVDFTAQRIDAHVVLAGTDLGRTSVNNATALPRNEDVGVDADLTVGWNDLPRLLVSTAMVQNVPYHIDGTVRVGSSDIHFDVPFQVDSTLPRQILVDAARNAVPQGGAQLPTQLPTQLPQGLPSLPAAPAAPGQF